MMALIAMAIIVAFVYSSFITIVQTLGIEWAGMDFWWELAALISIMLLGHWIEMNSIMRAQNAVGELAKLVPATADLIQGEEGFDREHELGPRDGTVDDELSDYVQVRLAVARARAMARYRELHA
jgi:cation transport ATPase